MTDSYTFERSKKLNCGSRDRPFRSPALVTQSSRDKPKPAPVIFEPAPSRGLSRSRALPHTILDRLDCGLAVGDCVDYFMRACCEQLGARIREAALLLCGCELGEVRCRQSNHVAGARDANRPYAGSQPFLD